MPPHALHAYVVADIEGSTGVWDYDATLTGTKGWRRARRELTADVNAAVDALFASGAEGATVKDFHRDGFNILPALLDRRARLVQGYYLAPVFMYGDLGGASAAFFLGLHASSGNARGFLSHTLTRRIESFEVNGRAVCEAELFACALGAHGVPLLFFSGCPAACREVEERMPWVVTCEVPKALDDNASEEARTRFAAAARERIRMGVREAASSGAGRIFRMEGPLECEIRVSDELLVKRAKRWGFGVSGSSVRFLAKDFESLLLKAVKLAYFEPAVYAAAPLFLPAARLLLAVRWNLPYGKW